MKKPIIIIVFLLLMISPLIAAHQSGCHAWHSWLSDSGSYECGDTGHCSQCPDNEYCKNGEFTGVIEIKPNTTTQIQPTPVETIQSTPAPTKISVDPPNVKDEKKNGEVGSTNSNSDEIVKIQNSVNELQQQQQTISKEQEKQKGIIESIVSFLRSLFGFTN